MSEQGESRVQSESHEDELSALRQRIAELESLVGATDHSECRRMEKALQESEERYRALFEEAPDPVFLVDPESLQIVDANRAAQDLLGRSPEEIAGLPAGEIFPARLEERPPAALRETLGRLEEGGEAYPVRTVLLAGDGREVPVEGLARMIQLQGRPVLMGTVRDISERRRVLQAIDDLAKFPDEDPAPVLRLAGDGRILYANEASGPLLQHWQCQVGQHMPETWRELMQEALDSGERREIEVEILDRSYYLTFAPIIEAGYVNVYGLDITERKQAEVQITRLAAVIEQSAEGMVITDLDGDITYVNPFFEKLTGYSAEEVLGQNPRILRSGYQGRAFYEQLWNAIGSGETWHGTFVNRRKDGELYYEAATIFQVKNAAGEPINYASVKRDITARKRADDKVRRRSRELDYLNQVGQQLSATLDLGQLTEQLLQSVTDIVGAEGATVWLWDEKQEWLICQAAFQRGHGPSMVNLRVQAGQGVAGWVAQTGERVVVASASDDPRFFSGIDQQTGFQTTSLLAVPFRYQDKVTGVLEVANKLNGDFDDGNISVVETMAASAAIAIENARLVEALRQRTVELQTRNEELDAFAHTVAHDLKGPLSPLIGYAEVMAMEFAEVIGERGLRFMAKVSESGRKMSSIINELLLLATISKIGEVEMGPLDMEEIVGEVRMRLSDPIEELGAEIVEPESYPTGVGYPAWVEEVWVNYLSNALKHGGRPPRIELGADLVPGGMVRFWVRDNGPGMTPEEQARLFKPFTRLDQVRAKGHGLGLSIVQRITDKLGGEVGVESWPGVGSRFSFTLPAA